MGIGQRAELSWSAEPVGGGCRARFPPLHVSHGKMFVQGLVAVMLFPSHSLLGML